MCLNKRYITNVYGKEVLVTCGKCPACLQAKALKNTFSIKNYYKEGYVGLFVTFTYDNECVPYFRPSEARYLEEYAHVPVYRDCVVYDGNRTRVRSQLTSLLFPLDIFKHTHFSYLSGKNDSVGVCYYPDIQNFFKRFRSNFKRKKGYDLNFDYFVCSEYGETTLRPHFHGLLYVPQRYVKDTKDVLSASWPFDDGSRLRDYTQIAYNAASYVSSYVNCVTSIPPLFRLSNDIRPRYSFSKNFRLVSERVSLDEVLQCFERSDFTRVIPSVKRGTQFVDVELLPVRCLSRFFPKIKGYSRLNADALVSICQRPQSLARFARYLRYNNIDEHDNDLKRNIGLLQSAMNRVAGFMDLNFYPFIYSRIWSVYYSNMMRLELSNISTLEDNFTAYDNIKDYYESKVSSDSLDSVMLQLPSSYHYESDCNAFSINISKDTKYKELFHRYDKKRKVKNYIYSQKNNF